MSTSKHVFLIFILFIINTSTQTIDLSALTSLSSTSASPCTTPQCILKLIADQNDLCLKANCKQKQVCVLGKCISTDFSSFTSIISCDNKTCADGQICQFGQCIQNIIGAYCTAQTQCDPLKSVCLNNKCFSATQNLNKSCDNIKCKSNYTCAFGKCVPTTFQNLCVNKEKKCLKDQLCYFGFCFADSVSKNVQACKAISCKVGQICTNGQCTGVSNVFDTLCDKVNCGANETCMYGKCINQTALQECSDLDCDSNSVCLMSECFPILNTFSNLFDQYKQKLDQYYISIQNNQNTEQTDTNQTVTDQVDKSNVNSSVLDLCAKVTCKSDQNCLAGQCIPKISQDIPSLSNCLITPCKQGQTCLAGICIKNKVNNNNNNTSNCQNKCNKDTQVCVNSKCFSIDENIKNLCNNVTCKVNQTCSFGSCTQVRFQNLCQANHCQSSQLCYFGFCFADTIRKNAQSCSKVKCNDGQICTNAHCNSVLTVFEGLCKDVLCKTGQTCMYGECVDQSVKKNCDNVKCNSSSICIFGQCFAIFSSFQNIFSQNQGSSQLSPSSTSSLPSPTSLTPGLCTSNSNCKSDQVCTLGVCIGVSACSPVCSSSQTCLLGKCVANSQPSNSNNSNKKIPCDSCTVQQVCKNNACVDLSLLIPNSCKTQADCKNSGQCLFGVCVNIPSFGGISIPGI